MAATALTQWLLPVALALIMFGIGLSLTTQDFIRLRQHPRLVWLGSSLQLIGLPVLGWLICQLFSLSAVHSVAVMILTLAPGGATSNMISYLSRADTALSISLTAIASLITPLTLPLLTYWVVRYWLGIEVAVQFPWLITWVKLLVVGVLPVLLGMLIRHQFADFARRVQAAVKWCSLLFMVVVVVGVVKGHAHTLPALLYSTGVALLTLAISAMLLAGLVARLIGADGRAALTIAIETGIQNAGLALLITAGTLQHQEMSDLVLLYGVLMQIPALLLIVGRYVQGMRRVSVG